MPARLLHLDQCLFMAWDKPGALGYRASLIRAPFHPIGFEGDRYVMAITALADELHHTDRNFGESSYEKGHSAFDQRTYLFAMGGPSTQFTSHAPSTVMKSSAPSSGLVHPWWIILRGI